MLSAAPSGFPRRLGVQLHTVRHVLAADVAGTLGALRRMGYDEVEFAGLPGADPHEVRAILDDVGLTAPAAHVGLDALQSDLGAHLEVADLLGHRFLVVPGLPEALRASLDGYCRTAEALNALGERTRAAGVRLAYHNHSDEFEPFEAGRSGYDVLLDETDPTLVSMELDVFWAVHAGHDPVDWLSRFPGRFPLLHVKDRTAAGEMTDVGAGEIDFARILACAAQAGLEHVVVEHDEPADALASVCDSYAALVRLRLRHP